MNQKEFDKIVRKNPGNCPKMDCANKVICSADYLNDLCYEKFVPNNKELEK
jgi:hypothetical protein